jgi:putative ABC transport system substrate-binding protein
MIKQRARISAVVAGVLLSASLWSACALAQAKLPRVGIIVVGAATDEATAGYRIDLVRRALAGQGWVEGSTVLFEPRNARGDPSRFAEMAAELVRLKVDLIWADSAPALRATAAATRAIPIVAVDFTTDPVSAGYAQSYGRPGGNVTGVFLDAPEFAAKWIELLKAAVPGLSRVAVIWDPSPGDTHVRALQAVAPSLGIQLQIVEVRKPRDIDAAAAAFRVRPQAIIVLPSPMTLAESSRLVRLAAAQRVPAISPFRLFAERGGTLAYGPEAVAVIERGAVQVTRILRGAKAGELPIERPTKYELVINLKAVTALGLAVPESVLSRADLVIQ